MVDFELIQSALSNMLVQAIAFVPRLITGFVILLIGWLVSKFLAAVIKRIAQQFRLDRVLESLGVKERMEQAGIDKTASEMVALFIYWMIFLNFLLIGLDSMGLTAAVEPLQNVIAFLPRFLASMVLLVAGTLLAQFIGRAAQAGAASAGVEFAPQIGSGVTGLLVVMVVIIVLGQLGIDASIMINIVTIVIAFSIGGLALAFGLGGRSVAQNVLAGYYAREQFALGDRVIIEGEEGTLEGIGTLNAEVRVGEARLIIPNSQLTETAVKIKG